MTPRYAKWYSPKGVYTANEASPVLKMWVWLGDFRHALKRHTILQSVRVANLYIGKNRYLL